MKHYKLKSWVKDTLTIIAVSITLAIIIMINNNSVDQFMSNCESAGYSHNYCVRQK